MKQTQWQVGIAAVLVLAVGVTSSLAADTTSKEVRTEAYVQEPPAEEHHWHAVAPDLMEEFHHPTDWLEMGLDFRFREVYGRNVLSTNEQAGDDWPNPADRGNYNNYHWQRWRTRWSQKWLISDQVTFNTRLTWEFWTHCAPDDHVPVPKLEPFFAEKNWDCDEAILDHFNVRWQNFLDMPLTVTAGRQDIILGTGWLVLDGTPGDGSRTIFFDAIRGQYQLSESTKLDMIYIQQYDDPGKWLKPINHGAVDDRRNLTQAQDEKGAILYLTHKLGEKTNSDAYYIYKKERQSELNEWWVDQGWTSNGGDDAEVHTFGGRLHGALNENWSYSAEGALQFGNSRYFNGDAQDLCAQGANTRLGYAFLDELKNEIHIGAEYLSGDDPDTEGDDERFNPLWGDWPQYQRGGDLQSYLWAFEGEGLGNVSNLIRFGIGHSFKPTKTWTIATDYNLYWADENSTVGGAPPSTLVLSDSGKFRGHMLSGIATYSCCAKFKTHFLLDYFIPGGYYESPAGDESLFARMNVEWTF